MGAVIGCAAGGRPDRRDPAKRRRNAQRAADVIAEAERGCAGGDDGRFAAAGAAAGSFQIPRIVGASVERIVGFREDHQLREVGLGNRNRAGRAQRRDVGIVMTFDLAAARGQPECRSRAGKIEAFLDRHWQAGKRRKLLAAHARFVDVRGGYPRALRQIDGDGVELAVDGFEPRDEVFNSFGGREIAGGNEPRDLARRHLLQVVRALRRRGGGNISERHDGSPGDQAWAACNPTASIHSSALSICECAFAG